jgi:L-alanine-DL-glutamate epimerase-like enolase superfamily enzyme
MPLRQLTARHESLPLARPFRISRGVKTAADVVIVEISEGGVTGRGEGVPYPRYGESVESALATIESQRAAIESGLTRIDLTAAMPAGAARNAIDCALWDLEMRLEGDSLFARLGLPVPPDPVATALTVGLDTPSAMAEAARALAEMPLIKVKVDGTDPLAQLIAVRDAAPRPRLIVDPNESWTMVQLEALQERLVELRVDLVEQPLPAGAQEGLWGFRALVPIAADESIHCAADLDMLPDGYGVINIKLDKAGGLTGALQLMGAARRRGLGVMTGCMISSSLSIAPALAIAAGSDFVDVDGPLWLADDRPGGVVCQGGMLWLENPAFWGSADRSA